MPRSQEEYARMRAEAQDKILDTAIGVFSKKGFSGTSINDIAEAANISGGLLYRYFKSKQDLFDKIIDYTVGGLQELIRMIDSSNNPKEMLEVICQETIENLNNEMYLNLNSMIVQGIISQDSPAFEKILTADKKMIGSLTSLIKKGQEQGVFIKGDPAGKTYLFMSEIQGSILMKIALGERFIPPTVGDMMSYLLKGENDGKDN